MWQKKVTKFIQFFSKTAHISGCKNVHICTFAIVTVQICTGTVAMYNKFFFFYLSSIRLLHSNVHNNPTKHKKKKEEAEDNHQSSSTTTTTQPTPTQIIWTFDNPPQSWPKINWPENLTQNHAKPKSSQTHQKTQLKINQNSLRNPTQKQSKPIGKPNSKSIQTHWKTIPNQNQNQTTDVAYSNCFNNDIAYSK